ncbi:MAG: ThuA domain-containing protein [Planctomycetaceae bacterium]
MLESAEPVALPVTDGLEVWLDAARIDAPAPSVGEESIGVPLASWPDASGLERHVSQADETARPRLVRIGSDAVVRFDGENDHFRATGLGRTLESATLFIVAAPYANPGSFRAFLAANLLKKTDFQTGLTVDLGPTMRSSFDGLNVEGIGFEGARDLLDSNYPFGGLHVMEIAIDPAGKQVRFRVDGKLEGTRPFDPSTLNLDELTIGARHYVHGGSGFYVSGFIKADIAEVVMYGRALAEDEARQVRESLQARHAALARELPELALPLAADGRVPLETVAAPPALQMFVPGFEVRQLPVTLPNINNVRYRPDGTLVALAYDGDIYLLSDTDGDGLEDKADVFWNNEGRVRSAIGMALTPPSYQYGEGAIIATKTEILLLADTDGDRKADKEIVVASGWPESFHSVDALGVAIDPTDHSVYFAIGTGNFTDPYMRDKEGNMAYRLDGDRSTIQRVARDFSKRDIFCTGVRFPVGLAINRHGDLFGTDQEGATWVPNGNPLDELLHLQEGRHYGFPARHPDLLPSVIDEPSTYDYSPQHQSTCGMIFNDPVGDGATFGPDFWAGDAVVSGYSRGKLWRTKLVKTPHGYLADNRLIACLNMLIVDAGIAPNGDLVAAVHSGGPDWGSGPTGEGKLYRISYADREAPQPVATWAAGPNEVHIAFNRPLDEQHLQGLVSGTRITAGEHVRAGDEFETLRPGYEVVIRQLAIPRYDLPVYNVQITPDRRELILVTETQKAAVHYAVELPGFGRPPFTGADDPAPGAVLPQYPRVDLDYALQGVSAEWQASDRSWSGWLPHVDLAAIGELMAGSASHAQFADVVRAPGRLRLRTQVELTNMLVPAVQPGSTLDYSLPPEAVTVRFEASEPFTLHTPAGDTEAIAVDGVYAATFANGPDHDRLVPVEVDLRCEHGNPRFTVVWNTADDDRWRALPLHRLWLPWAERQSSRMDELKERVIPELAGGSWARGRAVFHSKEANCFTCHSIRGLGGLIGPDLSNLIHRDYVSVLRDVTNPNYAINPDYIAHTVLLGDGRVFTGTLRNDGENLLISDTDGKVTTIARADVEQSAPTSKSIMPEKLTEKLPPDQLKDLLTYLLIPPPHMPLDSPETPPAPRNLAEVEAVLAGTPEPPQPVRPIHIVLVAGDKDHGPGEHDYPAWQKAWAQLLPIALQTTASTAWDWPSADDLARADVLVFYQKGTWTPERARDIDAFLKRGGGLVYIHYAVDGGTDAPGFAQRIGLAWQGGRSKFRHGPLELGFEGGADHPIARNFSHVNLVDESYWNLVDAGASPKVLASAPEEGEQQPLFWTLEPARGRVFVSIPGHYSWTFDDPLFRLLLFRGIAWTAREPVDRFNELVTIGARVTQPAAAVNQQARNQP